MSQLFASPDEPRPEGTNAPEGVAPVGAASAQGAVASDNAAVSGDNVPMLEAASAAPAPDASGAHAPVAEDPSAVFGTPAPAQVSALDYTIPPVPAGVPRQRNSRKGALAGIAAMALVMGTAGGVGGAAAYDSWGPDDTAYSTLPVTIPASNTQAPEGTVAAVAEAALPSVVQIEATNGGATTSTGSGVVIRADGYLLTNNHVIESSDGTVSVLFSDGEVLEGTIVGTSTQYDLAVVHVERTDLTPLVLGDSDAMFVGEDVIAIGSPLGLDSTVTTGIVSAKDRPVTTGDSEESVSYIAAIQTDAAINPGNSGGPLLNSAGEVIGINSAIAALPGATEATSAGSIGLGFAIPSNQARRVAEEIIATGKAEVPVIGAQLDPTYTGTGVLVADSTHTGGTPGVIVGSPADKAGLEEGDVIVAINGAPVADSNTAIVRIRSQAPGDKITLTVERDGKDFDLTMTLASADTVDFGDDTSTEDESQ